MKYIGENAIKKLIALIKGDLNKKLDKNQGTTNSGKILGVNASGEVAPTDTEVATLVDVPNGLVKGNGTIISQAVAGTDYVVPSTALNELPGHIANGDIHVTAEQKTAWNGKQTKITAKGLLKGNGSGGVSAAAAGTDYAAASHNHDSSYLKLSGGKLTGNLEGKYITGTWLQATENNHLANTSARVAVLDGSGWVYYRTPAEILNDIEAAKSNHDHSGRVIQPTSIELFPGASAEHGGYIDFHYNNDSADYTSRIIEAPSGYVTLNGMGIMTRANIAAAYNVSAQFTNGIFEYSNNLIKAGTICFAQFRGGLVTSSFQDTALATSSEAGKVKIVAKNGETFKTTVNVLMINL